MPKIFDVNSYCQHLSKSEVLSARLIGWTGRWSLYGSFVLCCQCLSLQAVDDASEPFKHLKGCSASEIGRYPWQELREVIDAVAAPALNKAIRKADNH
jgi:hypothetical protein